MNQVNSSTKLGIIDTLEVSHLLHLAKEVEAIGYNALWCTEHHSPDQCSNPGIAAAAVAAATNSLRVGIGGALAYMYSRERLASNFQLLATLFPERIEFGFVSATPPKTIAKSLHTRIEKPFTDLVRELKSAFRVRVMQTHLEQELRIWVCGTSIRSLEAALQNGTHFAFHDFLSTLNSYEKLAITNNFHIRKTNGSLLAIVLYGTCGQNYNDARDRWNRFYTPGLNPPPSFLGCSARCAEQIMQSCETYRPDVVLIQCMEKDIHTKVDMYKKIYSALKECGFSKDK
ncbi:LLM class flavin-dependent oxidoreductase [uncultured Gimesia sp.]|uniref:LLM class flavin-dependent oxidoreductase n=1 Tax=uncultured Gimesia sp. TaxID=1678688 RepID=UPI0030DB02C2|tara:strand:+ start:11255 stop:12115 length:861 start_codon:yes stop_codon:yes gene_type:complete